MSEQLIQAIAHRDSQTLSRLANRYQPTQEHTAKVVVNAEAERLVDALFRQLKQVFPASAATNLRTEADEAAAKQQWILAFAENGITKREQLASGMKRARASLSPFWPSPGQFINWCREEEFAQAGLPSINELVTMVHSYSANRGYYDSPEEYPWTHAAHYWLVIALYSGMKNHSWNECELKQNAKGELISMAARIFSGEIIPFPRKVIHQPKKKTLGREQALNIIAAIRKKYNLYKY
ncbi:replication protein P [Cronobacter dublinensis]